MPTLNSQNKVATIIVINHTAVNNQKLDKLSDNDVASSYKEQTIYFIIAHSGDRCMNKPEFKQQYQTGVLQFTAFRSLISVLFKRFDPTKLLPLSRDFESCNLPYQLGELQITRHFLSKTNGHRVSDVQHVAVFF
ncbi:hypothetical protein Tsp_08734 [Trichinella spiralis]|uniref:hypothetical protein n=1 Tax=Trichinella spiralis TaxID=6334 RepID=UPI0001EFE13D|nr:hypothetical protein Tsp_08734 [Trichinella spiralis]